MHVAFFAPGWPVQDFQNGIVTYVAHMRAALLALGHQVTIVTATISPGNVDADVVRVQPSWGRALLARLRRRDGGPLGDEFSAAIAATFLRVHRRRPIDVIEMEETFGWVGALRDLPVPVVVKLHGPAFLTLLAHDRGEPAAEARVEREGLALAKFGLITAPSRRTAAETIDRYRLAAEVIHVRNPIDPSPMRTWCAASADPRTVLFVGRFDNLKGADTVLGAFKLLLARAPDARLVFVGPDKGLVDTDGSVARFDAYARRHFSAGEREQIRFTGPLDPAAIQDLRLRARVTVVASRWETAGYTAAEALAQGCPVAVMDCPGVDEVVFHEKTGLVATSAGGLAAHILELFQDDAKAVRLGVAGRQFISDTHAPSVAVRSALSVYAHACGTLRTD